MPVIGAVADFTSYRRDILLYTGLGSLLMMAVEASIGPKTWFPLLLLHCVPYVLVFLALLSVHSAYLPELCQSNDETVNVTTAMQLWESGWMLGYLILVVVLDEVMGWSNTEQAMVAQGITVLLAAPLLYACWSRLGPRGASH